MRASALVFDSQNRAVGLENYCPKRGNGKTRIHRDHGSKHRSQAAYLVLVRQPARKQQQDHGEANRELKGRPDGERKRLALTWLI